MSKKIKLSLVAIAITLSQVLAQDVQTLRQKTHQQLLQLQQLHRHKQKKQQKLLHRHRQKRLQKLLNRITLSRQHKLLHHRTRIMTVPNLQFLMLQVFGKTKIILIQLQQKLLIRQATQSTLLFQAQAVTHLILLQQKHPYHQRFLRAVVQ